MVLSSWPVASTRVHLVHLINVDSVAPIKRTPTFEPSQPSSHASLIITILCTQPESRYSFDRSAEGTDRWVDGWRGPGIGKGMACHARFVVGRRR